jgi:hypothetical protein
MGKKSVQEVVDDALDKMIAESKAYELKTDALAAQELSDKLKKILRDAYIECGTEDAQKLCDALIIKFNKIDPNGKLKLSRARIQCCGNMMKLAEDTAKKLSIDLLRSEFKNDVPKTTDQIQEILKNAYNQCHNEYESDELYEHFIIYLNQIEKNDPTYFNYLKELNLFEVFRTQNQRFVAMKVAENRAKCLLEALLDPELKGKTEEESKENVTKKIKSILEHTYKEFGKDYRQALYKQLLVYLHPDKILQNNEETFKFLQELNLSQLPAQQNINYFEKYQLLFECELLTEKYKEKINTKAKEGTILGFLEHTFKAYHNNVFNKNIYINSIDKEMERYPFVLPFGDLYALSYASLWIVNAVRIIALAPINAIIFSCRFLVQGFLNLVTEGLYKQTVVNYLDSNKIIKEAHLKESKRFYISLFLNTFKKNFDDEVKSLEAMDQIRKVDRMENYEEYMDYLALLMAAPLVKLFPIEIEQGKKLVIDYHIISMSTKISSWANLNLVLVSYYKAITKPLSEIDGIGYKFLSVALIRPLQIISAFVVIPVITGIEVALLAKKAINYTLTTLLTLSNAIALAVFLAPLKAYDLVNKVVQKIKGKPKPEKAEEADIDKENTKNSSAEPMSKLSKKTNAPPKREPEPEPVHSSSPLKSKSAKKPGEDSMPSLGSTMDP